MNKVEKIIQYLNERNKAAISYLGVNSDDFSKDIMGIIRNVSEDYRYVPDDIYIIADAPSIVKFQRDLRDYSIMEGSSISNIGDDKVNLDFHKYRFAGKNIHIAWYESDLDDNEIDSSVKFEFVDDREHYVTEEDILNIFKDVFKNYGKVK